MKTKMTGPMMATLLLASILSVTMVAADPVSKSLVADGGDGIGVVIGTVEVSNNDVNLTVTFTITADDWYLNETHVAVADALDDIPQTKKGNPRPGRFDHKMEQVPGVKTFQYNISLADIVTTDGVLCIAAHAEVTNMDEVVYVDPETGEIYYREETAWGDGEPFGGRNWAMYFEYNIQED